MEHKDHVSPSSRTRFHRPDEVQTFVTGPVVRLGLQNPAEEKKEKQ